MARRGYVRQSYGSRPFYLRPVRGNQYFMGQRPFSATSFAFGNSARHSYNSANNAGLALTSIARGFLARRNYSRNRWRVAARRNFNPTTDYNQRLPMNLLQNIRSFL